MGLKPIYFFWLETMEDIDPKLNQICEEEMCNINQVEKVWPTIPVNDQEPYYFENACLSLLQISTLIDDEFQGLAPNKRLAKKYRLMAKLLGLKAQELDIDMV